MLRDTHKNKPKDAILQSNQPSKSRNIHHVDRPIPDRSEILTALREAGHPVDFDTLAEQLGVTDITDQSILTKRLNAMERDGQLMLNRAEEYLPIAHSDLIAGRVIGHPEGFGFLVPDDGSDDLFLSGYHMRRLMHGDRALASVTGIDKKGRREGAIVEVIERNSTQVVGRYFMESGIGFVEPDNKRLSQDIVIPPNHANGANNGQIVVASIIDFPTSRSQAIGKITEVLGDHLDPGMEIEIALRSHDLPFEWPNAATQEAEGFSPEVPEAAKEGRLDLREVPLVTIDGEDSRDFDDAVYCERDANGNWRLLVAIADVSHYVKPDSALDKEAFNRATSVYFPSKVIPMLPEVLSNGLCSLNPAVDRLCMVCEITIDEQNGEILDYQFHEALMHSAARLTYTKVAAMVVDRTVEARNEYANLVHHLDDLYSLYRTLRKRRSHRGAIDFETIETRVIFDEEQKIEAIRPTERNDAHKIIEECMILANICAAKFLDKHKIAAPHRAHPLPKQESISDLREFLATLGLALPGGDEPEPKDYANLLKAVQDRPDVKLIQTALLRSLTQATYSEKSSGHFGLALQHYTHFTSPIRRYPDLLVHRAIRHLIRNDNKPDGFIYDQEKMHKLCDHSSMAERRADDASRDVMAWLKCEYMQDHVGNEYEGIIATVTGFGLFVELNDIYVEGLVHVTALPGDYYHYDNVRQEMVGETTKRRYRLGDGIFVVVARVDLDDRKIDFTLVEDTQISPKPPREKKKSRSKSKKKR